MSAILAVCGDGFCAMVSDGRFVEEPITGDKPHVIKNDLLYRGGCLNYQLLGCLPGHPVSDAGKGRQNPAGEGRNRGGTAGGRAPDRGRPQPQG